MIAYADSIDELFFKLNDTLLNPIIEFMFIVAFVVFIYGVMQYLRNADQPDKRQQGQKHMLFGLLGFLIMFTVYGIINLLLNTFGIQGATINQNEQTFNPPTIQDVQLPEIKTGN
jgi:hypothetical protein